MPMPTGPVQTEFIWASYEAEVKGYLFIESTDTTYDTILQRLVGAAACKADEYLMNAFEDLTPKITVDGPEANDQVEINGCVFTAKATEDADEREFALGATDAETAENLLTLINSEIVGGVAEIGVPGVTVTRSDNVLTLTKRYPNVTTIDCSSTDDDKLRVDVYRVAADVPYDVILWCLAFIAWRFENRDGRKSERTEAGVTGVDWGNRPSPELLDPYAMHYGG